MQTDKIAVSKLFITLYWCFKSKKLLHFGEICGIITCVYFNYCLFLPTTKKLVGAVKGKIYCMKKLMLGNEAFARGLYEAGCKVVSSYPGTPSTEITEAVAKYDEVYAEWALSLIHI